MAMTLSKAIELNTTFTARPFDASLHDNRDAIKLGIEALKAVIKYRAESEDPPEHLLPGEEL